MSATSDRGTRRPFSPRAFLGPAMAVVLAVAASPAPGQQRPAIHRTFDVGVQLRDGTRLSANVFRPDDGEPVPVVVARTPYDNSGAWREGEYFATHGYAYVSVDVRGRYDSDGDFYPYRTEATDGYDVIQWAAEQPWSDGRVVTMGGSYMGFDQWLAAAESPPALAAMSVQVSPVDYYDSPAHTGGAFNLAGRLPWTTMVDARTNQSLDAPDWEVGLRHLPLATSDAAIGRTLEAYRDWVEHPDRDEYWEAFSVEGRWDRVGVPVLHQGGWYDEFVRGTLAGFRGMRRANVAGQLMIVGPWTHGMSMGPVVGAVDFGPASQIDHRDLTRRFFDHVLSGNPAPQSGRVRLFVMGENEWRDFEDWPVPHARPARWYLDSDGTAADPPGGTLSTEPPAASGPPDTYLYDPMSPVPTLGGGTCCVYPGLYPEIVPWGPQDHRPIEARPDVLVYTSDPMTAPMTVAGPVGVHLSVSTDQRDTDFVARLLDVAPDGRAINLADGIIRARYRNGTSRPELLEPGATYELTVDLAGTANTFLVGHRVRLEVTSSNFPWYDRNLNTGRSLANDTTWVTARQVVYHDPERPSWIVLPTLPR